jgi:hypothetical protein
MWEDNINIYIKSTCDNVVFVSPDETEASGGLFN